MDKPISMTEFNRLVSKLAMSQRMAHEYLVLLEPLDRRGRVKMLFNRAIGSADMLSNELKKHVTEEIAASESKQALFLHRAHDLLLNIAATEDDEMMNRTLENLIKAGEVK